MECAYSYTAEIICAYTDVRLGLFNIGSRECASPGHHRRKKSARHLFYTHLVSFVTSSHQHVPLTVKPGTPHDFLLEAYSPSVSYILSSGFLDSCQSRHGTQELCCPLRSSGRVLVVTISSRLLWLFQQGLGKDCTGATPKPVSSLYRTRSFVRMACHSLTPACRFVCDVSAVLSTCKDSFEAGKEDDMVIMMVNIEGYI